MSWGGGIWALGTCVVVVASLMRCSAEDVATRAAQGYFEKRLNVYTSAVLGSRFEGGECAVVALRAPDGRHSGVAVVKHGNPARWQAIGMSRKLRLRDFVDDGDGSCGLDDARELHPQPDPEQPIQLGASYRYVVRAPCGVPQIHVDGSAWTEAPPWRGDNTVPSGERADSRYGRLTIITPARAVFSDMKGHILRFARQGADSPATCSR